MTQHAAQRKPCGSRQNQAVHFRGICTPEYHRSRQKRVQAYNSVGTGYEKVNHLPFGAYMEYRVHILLYQALWRPNIPLSMESRWALCFIISPRHFLDKFPGHWLVGYKYGDTWYFLYKHLSTVIV